MSERDSADFPRSARRWPLWKIIMAYVVFAVLAAVAIWYIDRKAHVVPEPAPTTSMLTRSVEKARAEQVRSAPTLSSKLFAPWG